MKTKKKRELPLSTLRLWRARTNDKFRPRYSAGVHRTYSFASTYFKSPNLSVSEQISKRKFIILLCYIFLFCFLYILFFNCYTFNFPC